MKNQLLLILLSIVLLSCNNSNEDKINKGFSDYVNKNFDNPDNIENIVDIKCIDTLSWKNQISCSRLALKNYYLIDSINSMSNNVYKNEVYRDLVSLSQRKRNAVFVDFMEYIDCCRTYDKFLLDKVIPFHENTITDMEKLIKLKDTCNVYCLLYKIKYRIKTDKNTKYLKTCYCYVHNNGCLDFKNEQSLENMPYLDEKFINLYEYNRECVLFIEQYSAMASLKQEKLNDLKNSILLIK